eukprot:TRINITY_DN290_c2_g1_i1.p1 TRINITY_DN290_c2_g1~~TRINITY_DN290_c2_g1_i1.p1  ORF type:complete len:824 (-),score=203.32 TRINITY_DN290_c2_g1_i1:579-3050(-)
MNSEPTRHLTKTLPSSMGYTRSPSPNFTPSPETSITHQGGFLDQIQQSQSASELFMPELHSNSDPIKSDLLPMYLPALTPSPSISIDTSYTTDDKSFGSLTHIIASPSPLFKDRSMSSFGPNTPDLNFFHGKIEHFSTFNSSPIISAAFDNARATPPPIVVSGILESKERIKIKITFDQESIIKFIEKTDIIQDSIWYQIKCKKKFEGLLEKTIQHSIDSKVDSKDPSTERISVLEKTITQTEKELSALRALQLSICRHLNRIKTKRERNFGWSESKQMSIVEKRIPLIRVKSLSGSKRVLLEGPRPDENMQIFTDSASAQTVSTYPNRVINGEKRREGDPICDRFGISLHSNRCIFAIADGCNWGKRPANAALAANSAFMKYISKKQHKIDDTQKAGKYLIRAFAESHQAVIHGFANPFDAGTTTLLGGIVLQNESESPRESFSNSKEDCLKKSSLDINSICEKEKELAPEQQWSFVCASVGDCKAFHWSKRTHEVKDVTAGNRTNLLNASDCGGRLGPQCDGGAPDLRNFQLFFCSAEDGDLLISMSDGVHDNLDPQQLGNLPSDLEDTFSVDTQWTDVHPETAFDLKNKFQTGFLKQRITEHLKQESDVNVLKLAQELISHCTNLTESSRKFMEGNPGKALPSDDYINYPGKMDHTTLAILRLVKHPELLDEDLLHSPRSALHSGSSPKILALNGINGINGHGAPKSPRTMSSAQFPTSKMSKSAIRQGDMAHPIQLSKTQGHTLSVSSSSIPLKNPNLFEMDGDKHRKGSPSSPSKNTDKLKTVYSLTKRRENTRSELFTHEHIHNNQNSFHKDQNSSH